ncbi:MAG: type II toxin-antitoxin system RelE/ParE family toxin [Planctomycetes bacterium]|nr:type II toxin-antitoxin system RelE/ParE family toxin [Planctomycetota bacterium]
MAGSVFWRRRAEQDLTEAYPHIGADSRAAAERLPQAVEDAVRFRLDNPGAGRLRELLASRAQSVRSWVVKGFQAYLILYRSKGDDLEVVRFLHGARDLPRLLEDES